MQEIIIEIMLTFCVGAMTFSVKRGGSEPMHDLRLSMEFQNNFNERAKLSRRITVEQKIKSLPASHLRALLRHLTKDRNPDLTTEIDYQRIVKSRRKAKKSVKSWRRILGENKIKTSRFKRFKQFHENYTDYRSHPSKHV